MMLTASGDIISRFLTGLESALLFSALDQITSFCLISTFLLPRHLAVVALCSLHDTHLLQTFQRTIPSCGNVASCNCIDDP